jgi:hypothetical protein
MNNPQLLLLTLLGRDFRTNWPFWKKKVLISLARWRNEVLSEICKVLVLLLCTGIGYLVFLYYLQSLWAVFSNTPMGNQFTTNVSPEFVEVISEILSLELSRIAFSSVLNTFLVTFAIGIVLKFSGLYHLTYLNRGIVIATSWGIICMAAAAMIFPFIFGPDALQENSAIYFLPTFCLLTNCFKLSAKMIPEFTVCFKFSEFLRGRIMIIKIRDFPPFDQPEI